MNLRRALVEANLLAVDLMDKTPGLSVKIEVFGKDGMVVNCRRHVEDGVLQVSRAVSFDEIEHGYINLMAVCVQKAVDAILQDKRAA